MSHSIYNQCRRLQMPASAKAVLLTLADIADDNGCTRRYAPLDVICQETCLHKSTVIDAIKWLQGSGIIQIETIGRQSIYTVTPDSFNPDYQKPSRRQATRTPEKVGQPDRSGKTTGRANRMKQVGMPNGMVGMPNEQVGQNDPIHHIHIYPPIVQQEQEHASTHETTTPAAEFPEYPELKLADLNMRLNRAGGKPVLAADVNRELDSFLAYFENHALSQNQKIQKLVQWILRDQKRGASQPANAWSGVTLADMLGRPAPRDVTPDADDPFRRESLAQSPFALINLGGFGNA